MWMHQLTSCGSRKGMFVCNLPLACRPWSLKLQMHAHRPASAPPSILMSWGT